MGIQWNKVSNGTKKVHKTKKDIDNINIYLGERAEKGYFFEKEKSVSADFSKIEYIPKKVRLLDCKTSTLNRYVKIITTYYYMSKDYEEKEYLESKLTEIGDIIVAREKTESENKN